MRLCFCVPLSEVKDCVSSQNDKDFAVEFQCSFKHAAWEWKVCRFLALFVSLQSSFLSFTSLANLSFKWAAVISPDLSYVKRNWQLLEWEHGVIQWIRQLNQICSDLLINALPFGAGRVRTCAPFTGSERERRDVLLGWTINTFYTHINSPQCSWFQGFSLTCCFGAAQVGRGTNWDSERALM